MLPPITRPTYKTPTSVYTVFKNIPLPSSSPLYGNPRGGPPIMNQSPRTQAAPTRGTLDTATYMSVYSDRFATKKRVWEGRRPPTRVPWVEQTCEAPLSPLRQSPRVLKNIWSRRARYSLAACFRGAKSYHSNVPVSSRLDAGSKHRRGATTSRVPKGLACFGAAPTRC